MYNNDTASKSSIAIGSAAMVDCCVFGHWYQSTNCVSIVQSSLFCDEKYCMYLTRDILCASCSRLGIK